MRDVGRSVAFHRNEYLLTVGAASDSVLLIESGVVKAVLVASDGTEFIVGFLGRGDLVGELGVLNRAPRSAHIVALTPVTATQVAGRHFLRLRSRYSDVLELVDGVMHRRVRNADEGQLALARDVTSRLGASLVRWARDLGEVTEDGLLMRGISQRDMAQAIAVSEKSVEASLGALRSAGWVRTWRLGYLVVDPVKLSSITRSSGEDLLLLPEIRG